MQDERESKLPAWARELITELRRKTGPNDEELSRLRNRVNHLEGQLKRLKNRADAMETILTCADRGGSETAREWVARVLDENDVPTKPLTTEGA